MLNGESETGRAEVVEVRVKKSRYSSLPVKNVKCKIGEANSPLTAKRAKCYRTH